MKRIIKIFIGILLLVLMSIIYMDNNDRQYDNKLRNRIIKNTGIKNIEYINYYDDYYVVIDKDNLYLYDNEYKEILKVDRIIIYKNDNDYDIIYKDGKLMYFDDILKDNKLIYRYYNIYNYELIDEVLVGGVYD